MWSQIETFDYCIKVAPKVVGEVMMAVIHGNAVQLEQIINTYALQLSDLLQMRGFDFVCPIDIEDPKSFKSDLRLTVDAYNWNPIHFATVYKRF